MAQLKNTNIDTTLGVTGQIKLANSTATAPALTFDSDNTTGIFLENTGEVGIAAGGSPQIYINSSGNIGLGKTDPTTKLDVNGSVAVTGSLSAFGNITVRPGANTYRFTTSTQTGYFFKGLIWSWADPISLNNTFRTFTWNELFGAAGPAANRGRILTGTGAIAGENLYGGLYNRLSSGSRSFECFLFSSNRYGAESFLVTVGIQAGGRSTRVLNIKTITNNTGNCNVAIQNVTTTSFQARRGNCSQTIFIVATSID